MEISPTPASTPGAPSSPISRNASSASCSPSRCMLDELARDDTPTHAAKTSAGGSTRSAIAARRRGGRRRDSGHRMDRHSGRFGHARDRRTRPSPSRRFASRATRSPGIGILRSCRPRTASMTRKTGPVWPSAPKRRAKPLWGFLNHRRSTSRGTTRWPSAVGSAADWRSAMANRSGYPRNGSGSGSPRAVAPPGNTHGAPSGTGPRECE